MTVLVTDIVDHLAAPFFTEVDIKVRGTHTFRVEEPFKKQSVLQRVDVGDQRQIRHQTSGTGAAPRSHRDSLPFGVGDKVGNHQKVTDESCAFDDAQFVVHTLNDGLLLRGVAFSVSVKTVAHFHVVKTDVPQKLLAGDGPVGKFVHRVVVDLWHIVELHGTAFRHQTGVGDGFGDLFEKLPHLLFVLEVELR